MAFLLAMKNDFCGRQDKKISIFEEKLKPWKTTNLFPVYILTPVRYIPTDGRL